jgi:hypothetical protein
MSTTTMNMRDKVARLAEHPGTPEGERAAAEAALDRLDSKPSRKRHVQRKVATGRCAFPDPYLDEFRWGHPFTYTYTTKRPVFCEAHQKGWYHEFDIDGEVVVRKRGDNRRARKNPDGSYTLVVEEVYSDAAVHAMLREAGYGQADGAGVLNTRVSPDLYRALKVKGTKEVHPIAFSLDREWTDEEGDPHRLVEGLTEDGLYGMGLAEAGPAMPGPYVVPSTEAASLITRRSAPIAMAFTKVMRGMLGRHLGPIVLGWREDPVETAKAYRAAAIALEEAYALEAGQRRNTPVLNGEAPSLIDSNQQEAK